MIYIVVQSGWGLILTKLRYLDPNIQVDKSDESEDPRITLHYCMHTLMPYITTPPTRRRLDRHDPVRRAQEQIVNTNCRKFVRQDPVCGAQEIDCRRLDRQDPVCRAQEQIADTDCRQLERKDPVCRAQEQISNTDHRGLVR